MPAPAPRPLKAPAKATKRRAAPAPQVLALQQFRLIFKSVKKHFQWTEQQTGVGGASLWAMAVVVERPGLKVTELAAALSIHQSTASNLVDKLARQGYVRRERDAVDQRVVHLHPELKAEALLASAPGPVQGVLPDALDQLTSQELSELNALLARVISRMKVRDTSGRSTPLSEI